MGNGTCEKLVEVGVGTSLKSGGSYLGTKELIQEVQPEPGPCHNRTTDDDGFFGSRVEGEGGIESETKYNIQHPICSLPFVKMCKLRRANHAPDCRGYGEAPSAFQRELLRWL